MIGKKELDALYQESKKDTSKESKLNKKDEKISRKEQTAETTARQTEQIHVCAVCHSDQTAHRMNGKPRWHETIEGEFLCHRCYNHSRGEVE